MHPVQGCGADRWTGARHTLRAFSLVDVLVSIAVIGVLISLLLPTLSHVRESTRRIVCQSNLRQVGLGIAQYADEYDDFLAPSQFYEPDQFLPAAGTQLAQMMTLRVGNDSGYEEKGWDGLGLLYSTYQLRAPEIFYCPSHYGDHGFQNYMEDWRVDTTADATQILGNYHYRGIGPNQARRLRSVEPVRAALVVDGMRTSRDINHRIGMNVLRADLSVSWFADNQSQIAGLLASSSAGEPTSNSVLSSVWLRIDHPGSSLGGNGSGSGQ